MPARIFLLGLGLVAWAQIQVTSSDLPSPGAAYTVSQSRPQPGLDFLATGAGHTWDFAQLPSDTQFTIEWKSPAQVPQYVLSCGNLSSQALFLKVADSIPAPGVSIRDIYAFLRKSSQQMAVHGVGASVNGIPITECYRDPDEIYMLPLQYGRQDSTTFWLRISFPLPNAGNATLSQRGYRLHKVDGYGQLTTPYGTFQVLRLWRKVYQRDTIFFNGIPIQRRDTSFIELEWLAQGQGIPLLRVQGNTRATGTGTIFVPVLIQFKYEPRSTALSIGGDKLVISPNPSRGTLNVPLPGAAYQLYNLIGRPVGEGVIPSDGVLRLAPTLPEGVYFLRLVHEGRVYWHRFALTWE